MFVFVVITFLTLHKLLVMALECKAWEPALTEQVLPVLDVCYLVYSKDLMLGWNEAKEHCERFGGLLAKIKNLETDFYLSQKLEDGEEFWIGVSRQPAKGSSGYEWVYTDGEKAVFSLLTDPPNYMETTVVHVLYMVVWADLQTCPWEKGNMAEEKRFICQYTYTAPEGIKFPSIDTGSDTWTTTQVTTSTTDTTSLTTPYPTTAPYPTTTSYPTTTQTKPAKTTTERPKTVMQRQLSTRRLHRRNVLYPPFKTFYLNNSLECLKICSQHPQCIGVSIRKSTSTCHIYSDHEALEPATMGEEKGWNTFKILFQL